MTAIFGASGLTLHESAPGSRQRPGQLSTYVAVLTFSWQGTSASRVFVQILAHLHAALFCILSGITGKLVQATMDQASEIGTTPDVDQDAALLCSVSDQMHLDARQKASVCAPHPSRGRFRSSVTTARCRMIGESSTKDTERDSRKVQSSFFINERLSHEQQRSPFYVLQVGVSVRKTGSVSVHPVSLLHALQSSLCAVTSHDHSYN